MLERSPEVRSFTGPLTSEAAMLRVIPEERDSLLPHGWVDDNNGFAKVD